jgi:hypothetical protein
MTAWELRRCYAPRAANRVKGRTCSTGRVVGNAKCKAPKIQRRTIGDDLASSSGVTLPRTLIGNFNRLVGARVGLPAGFQRCHVKDECQ